MITRILSALLLISLFAPLSGVIFESDDIHVISNHLHPQKRILLLFDIDNTIARSSSVLGSDEWNSYKLQELVAQGNSYLQAVHIHIPLFFQLMHELELELVDHRTADFIAHLQTQNHHVCALTARSRPIMERTVIQLQNVGINFVSSSPFSAKQYHDNCHCLDGIIFTDGTNKGIALDHVLKEHAHLHYDLVIFVDDKRKYLEEVETVLAAYGIEFVGIRYSRADHFVHAYDPAVADQLLEQWLAQKASV